MAGARGGWRNCLLVSAFGTIFSLVVAASAWACVPFASLRVDPVHVQPGQEVTLTGGQFRPQFPVIIRLDRLDGPELAQVFADSPKGPFFKTTMVIPTDVTPGSHVLIATQEIPEWIGAPPWGIPARGL